MDEVDSKWSWSKFFIGFVSRKFVVFVLATVLMFMGKLEGWMWAAIAGAYLGINILQHRVER